LPGRRRRSRERVLQLSWSGTAGWLPGLVLDAVARGGTNVTTNQRALVTALVYTGLAMSAATVSSFAAM
jgi:hypothetical protein